MFWFLRTTSLREMARILKVGCNTGKFSVNQNGTIQIPFATQNEISYTAANPSKDIRVRK